jgi:carboxypeptidase T
VLTLALIALVAMQATAVAAPRPVADGWVELPEREDHQLLADLGLALVEGQQGDWWHVHGELGADERARAAGLSWRQAAASRHTGSGYPAPDEVEAALDDLEAKWPERVRRVDLGLSVDGRTLAGVWISDTATPRGVVRVLGAHHGDEQSSGVVALELARTLAEQADTDAEIGRILSTNAVLVVPVVNPDGVVTDSRYNSRSVDLNRNYDYEWRADEFRAGDRAFSEPETRAIAAMAAWSPHATGLSLHAGATNIGWVWNYTTSPTDDSDLLAAMADAYLTSCGTAGFWATNGGSWYTSNGDTNDWSYGRHGTLDFTVEVSLDKAPDAASLPAIVEEHLSAIIAFISWEPLLAGRIVDDTSGRGIQAQVALSTGGAPLVAAPDGHFARPVDEDGSYEVLVWASGYETASFTVGTTDPLSDLRLVRASMTTLAVEPALLSQTGDGTFELDVDAREVSLFRDGHDPVSASAVDGRWQVDPSALQAGPWSLVVDGQTAPRSLFIGEVDDAVVLQSAEAVDDELTVRGTGFGRGSRAWLLVGEERACVELELAYESADELVFAFDASIDASPDLVVLSNGYQLAVADMLGSATIDTGAPPDSGWYDTGPGTEWPIETSKDERDTACSGCGNPDGRAVLFPLLPLILVVRVRRRADQRSSL